MYIYLLLWAHCKSLIINNIVYCLVVLNLSQRLKVKEREKKGEKLVNKN